MIDKYMRLGNYKNHNKDKNKKKIKKIFSLTKIRCTQNVYLHLGADINSNVNFFFYLSKYYPIQNSSSLYI